MSATVRKAWTHDEFLAWVSGHEGRYEFDGAAPVAMTGGTFGHSLIMANLHDGLRRALRGFGWRCVGPYAGMVTVGNAIRYPDALITGATVPHTARTVPGVVAAFEVVSPSSSRNDRITKVREYAGVPSMRYYVVLESTTAALTVFFRDADDDPWTAATLTGDDRLLLPGLGVDLPVAGFYEDVDLSDAAPDGG